MITEEQKQEAERVYTEYYHIWINSDMLLKVEDFKKLVIQDRKSVLEEVKLMPLIVNKWYTIYKNERIQSITNQIEYLKSKI